MLEDPEAILNAERAAVEIAKILTGNDDFEWDWKEGNPVASKFGTPSPWRTGRWRCNACKMDVPLEEAEKFFSKDKWSPGGFKYKCKACASKALKEYQQSKKTKKKGTKKMEKPTPAPTPPQTQTKKRTLLLEMGDLEREYRLLLEVAREEERTPEGQIRWWIRKLLKEEARNGKGMDHIENTADVRVLQS